MSLERGQPVFKSFLCYGNLQESPQCPRWHGVVLKVGCAGVIVLLVMVAVLSAWVFQGFSNKAEEGSALKSDGVTQRTGSGGERNASLEDLFSRLKQSLCDPAEISSADGSGCKVCPRDWLPHRDKCYWVSKESKFWSESFKDCEMRTSQMLVIQDREEMELIQNITQGTSLVWIGLTIKSPEKKWTWVDTSPLDQSLFPVTGSAEGNSCGMIRRNRINSESCNTEFKWICQMGAILL
ncbi:killer cell lectin-like receptor subfamily B member 1 [Terrapene carolina triunguis]|uniref:killer cell lectin-like receptor subfamily B member 1 n=1 Tax=Terrapene triunguis TaxID=2587831 RepID=UPI000E77C7BD|nr:killer cell lectin-like receptor subfamily B member 1 [Terrapene carolina triunguis]